MSMRVISAGLTGKTADKAVLDGALSVARCCDGHIQALFVHETPRAALMIPDESYYPELHKELLAQMERQWTQAGAKARKSFEAWREQHGLRQGAAPQEGGGGPSADWREIGGGDETAVKRACRLVDLVVAALPARRVEAPSALEFDMALFAARRPVLLMPADGKLDPAVGPAVIAWNGSPEAFHAVTAALPILRALDDVFIFCAEEGAASAASQELAGYLAWHGIDAHPLKPAGKTHADVGEALLAAAHDAKAHLLVMGAYTHSRLREAFFGGVTKHVLAHARLPVLMAH